MTPLPFGILSSSGAVAGTAFELISTTVLGSATSNVTFSSLSSSTYKHLQLRIAVRSTRGFTTDSLALQFNGDTSNHTGKHYLRNQATSSTSSYLTSGFESFQTNFLNLGDIVASTAPSGAFSPVIIDILDAFSTNKTKVTRSMQSALQNWNSGEPEYLYFVSGLYNSTSALSSIKFTSVAGSNFATGSRFSLYGVKG